MDAGGNQATKFDLDIWYNPRYDNYFRLLKALSDLGQDVKDYLHEKTPNPLRSYFRFELDTFTLDFLPKLKSSAKFKPCYEKRERATIQGIEISIISFDELLEDKRAIGRPKDLEDIMHLKATKQLE